MEQLSSLMECLDRDEVKGKIPEGTYLEMCNLLRDAVRHQPIPRVPVEHRDEYMPSSSGRNRIEDTLSHIFLNPLRSHICQELSPQLVSIQQHFTLTDLSNHISHYPNGRPEMLPTIMEYVKLYYENAERFLQEHWKPSSIKQTERFAQYQAFERIDFTPYIPVVEGISNDGNILYKVKQSFIELFMRRYIALRNENQLKNYIYQQYHKGSYLKIHTKDVDAFTEHGKIKAKQTKSSHKVKITLKYYDEETERTLNIQTKEATTPYWCLHSVSYMGLSFQSLYYRLIISFMDNQEPNSPHCPYYSTNHLVWSVLVHTFYDWGTFDGRLFPIMETKLVRSGVGIRARHDENRTYECRLRMPCIRYLHSTCGGKNPRRDIINPLFENTYVEIQYIDHSKAEEPDECLITEEDATSNVRMA